MYNEMRELEEWHKREMELQGITAEDPREEASKEVVDSDPELVVWWPGQDKEDYEEVNSPKHYTQGDIETWDFIIDKNLDFLSGNIIKYVVRYKYKGGIKDLQKAKKYIEKLIERESANE